MRYLILTAMLLASCATSKQVYTSSGKQGYTINCPGAALTWNSCFEKAGEICGEHGYDVLERSDQQGVSGAATRNGAVLGSTFYRSMIIQCKPASN